jgi:D-tyrosyl-tRNA(Tyr) deacylase
MKALIQRVKHSTVKVDGEIKGKISKGILVFLGIGNNDTEKEIGYLIDKITNLRIFENEEKRMDFSLKDINGELLVISQFTLYGNTENGRRPDFIDAAKPEIARNLYEKFLNECKNHGIKTEGGVFGAMMDVELINDGPVTFMIESK